MRRWPAFLLCVARIAVAAEPVNAPDFQSPSLSVGFAQSIPAFSWFAVDSLGKTQNLDNTVLLPKLPNGDCALKSLSTNEFRYLRKLADGRDVEIWHISVSTTRIALRSEFIEGVDAQPFVLLFDQKKNHATVLGHAIRDEQRILVPCILHLPDHGTFRITASTTNTALEYDARRRQPENFVRVAFPPASREQKMVEYSMDVTLIHPAMAGLEKNPLYDGYRRNFLNLIQLSPRMGTLANNSSSDVCGFCFWEYSELALQAPPLAPGLTVLDLVRTSLDRVMNGGLTYGQVGYKKTPETPDAAAWAGTNNSLDTLPSFLIAACEYIQGSKDTNWGNTHFDRLATMGRQMLAQDHNGNGLIEYPLSGNSGSWTNGARPANWWDTIGFGHEDAYANALAYRGCQLMSEVAQRLNKKTEAEQFGAAARKIKDSYYRTFLNPQTGVLAGWKSADGKLHDYWFTFINGMAISFGLVENKEANAIMDKLLNKMAEVGYDRFDLGLPGNLIPVRKEDYSDNRKRYGGSTREDGSDGFQIYENGGATHCHSYWTIKALYRLGRVADARRIFYPMLKSFSDGSFQGFCSNGLSKDWRNWSGECNGYEGFLGDGYLALLAVEDDMAAGRSPRQE